MSEKSLEDVLVDELGDMYDAEKRMIHALPEVIRHTTSETLKEELRKHVVQSGEHVVRLRHAFELMHATPRRKHCKAMEGLLAECTDLMSELSQKAVRDTAILAAAQKIEHYEIATYVTLREWAQQLGQPLVSALLQEIIDEKIAADEILSHLALTLNHEAAHVGLKDPGAVNAAQTGRAG